MGRARLATHVEPPQLPAKKTATEMTNSLRSILRRCLAVALLLSIAPCALAAQGAFRSCDRRELVRTLDPNADLQKVRARIVGVYDNDTGEGIAGAAVVDIFTGSFVQTADGGAATLAFLSRPMGTPVRVRKIGYMPIDTILTCRDADTVDVTLLMTKGTSLPAVVTMADYNITKDLGGAATFEQRCHYGKVACLRGDSLRAYPARLISDFLRMEGTVQTAQPRCRMTMTIRGPVRTCGAMRSVGPGTCDPAYFLNGMYWTEPPSLVGIDSPLDVKDIAGIEIYRAGQTRPSRFEHDTNCGAVVIWTR
jgi:hypothetical protein